jgi:hypothetical protein
MLLGGETPAKTQDKRMEYLTNKIESIGGNVINIETIKKVDSPLYDEVNNEDGSTHVFYKINYILEDENKEGWAVLIMQPSLVTMDFPGLHDSDWILRL